MRQQRKPDKAITDTTTLSDILNTCHVGHLATNSGDGYPMVKPLNFAYRDGRLYLHSAREGEKMDHISSDKRVCFETCQPVAQVKTRSHPCDSAYLYRSVIIKGLASVVEDSTERTEAFSALMDKYQPEGGFGDYTEKRLGLTAIIRVDIESMSGKEDMGKGDIRDRAMKALASGTPLPVTLYRQE